MKKFDIALLTESRYEQPDKIDDYIADVLLEDNLLRKAFEKKGLKVVRVDWANKHFDWSSTKVAIFRSTWDYFYKAEEFNQWLAEASKLTQFVNPMETIRWNMDKHYLLDLQKNGINIPPTLFIEKREQTSLKEKFEKLNCETAILKPVVAGTARHTYKITSTNLAGHEELLQELIQKEAMLLQSFQYNIVTKGEISMVVIDGKFTHAILKKAKEGDFRVQSDFGGTVQSYTPTAHEIEFAMQVISVCNPTPYYARVDIFRDNQEQLAVGELELIEPELWFRLWPEAAQMLVTSVLKQWFE